VKARGEGVVGYGPEGLVPVAKEIATRSAGGEVVALVEVGDQAGVDRLPVQ